MDKIKAIVNKRKVFMKEKLSAMFGSVSFYMAVIGGIVLVLGQYDVIPADIATIIAGWCGFGVTKRTVDKAIAK